MLVVLEGCDGVGKSTLARSLAVILNAEVIHCSSTTPNDLYFFRGIVEASKSRNIIADRFCYGQFVYQEIGERRLGNDHVSPIENLHRLEVEMLEAGAKVLFVDAPTDEIKERLSARGESVINNLSIDDVRARFRGVFNQSILPVITWNTGRDAHDN